MQQGTVQVFRGIRYALPPTGGLRFSLPVPVQRTPGVLDASAFSPVAPQSGLLRRFSGGDCLSLNIWRRADAGPRTPVLFYVHGGMFTRGSGREPLFDGRRLARDWNIIVVTINYRLGMLGFVDFSCLNDGWVANPGLHDVVCALRWVHDNIAAFGGDPDTITAAGESAGGSLVSLLPVLEDAGPLLSRMVMMSGIPTGLLPEAVEQQMVHDFLDEHHMSCAEDLLRYSDAQLVALAPAFIRRGGLGAGTFQPTVDGRFLKGFPINLVYRGSYRPVPMLIGNTRDELSVLESPLLRRHWNMGSIVENGIAQEDATVRDTIAALYTQHYARGEGQVQLVTDMIFRTASLFYAEAASRASPVWLYRFDLRPAPMRAARLGAVHSSDLPLIFGNLRQGIGRMMFLGTHDLSRVRALSHDMQQDLVQFLRTGELAWPRVSSDAPIARAYDIPSRLVEFIPHDIYEWYRKTSYYRMNMQ